MAWWLDDIVRGVSVGLRSVLVIVNMALENIECSEHRESKDKNTRSRRKGKHLLPLNML